MIPTTWAEIYNGYFGSALVIALIMILLMIRLVWGLHLGTLPKTKASDYLKAKMPRCRCHEYFHRTVACPNKNPLGGLKWKVNLGFIQLGGPFCNFCFGDHRVILD